MKKCPKCGKINSSKFCTGCGYDLSTVDANVCASCGFEANSKFCPNCGALMEDAEEQIQTDTAPAGVVSIASEIVTAPSIEKSAVKKDWRCLFSAALLGLFVILSRIKIVYKLVYSIGSYTSSGKADLKVNMFVRTDYKWLAYIILICAVIGIITLILQYTGKNGNYLKYGAYVPAAATVLFLIHTILSVSELNNGGAFYGGKLSVAPAWGYYVELLLLVTASILSIKIAKDTPAVETPVLQQQSAETLDDLRKYKDLLDSGIITLDEYDAKKSEILGSVITDRDKKS